MVCRWRCRGSTDKQRRARRPLRLGLELLAVAQAHRALEPHGAKLAGVLHGAGADLLRAEHAQADHGSSPPDIGPDSEPPHLAPARGPPWWEDCDAQVGEGAAVEPDWDLAAQAAPDFEVGQRVNW